MKLGQSLRDAWKAGRESNLLAGAGCLFFAVGIGGSAVLVWAGHLLGRWLPSGFVERGWEWVEFCLAIGILVLLAAWVKWLLGRLFKWLFRVFRGDLSLGEIRWSLRGAGENLLVIVALPVFAVVGALVLPFVLLYELLKWLWRLTYMNLGQLRNEGEGVLTAVGAVVGGGLTWLAWMAFLVVGSMLLGGLVWGAVRALAWVFS